MNDHLSKEELELLSNNRFQGKGLFKALQHIENCEKCRSQIRLPTKEEILKLFEDDDVEEASPEDDSVQKKSLLKR